MKIPQLSSTTLLYSGTQPLHHSLTQPRHPLSGLSAITCKASSPTVSALASVEEQVSHNPLRPGDGVTAVPKGNTGMSDQKVLFEKSFGGALAPNDV
jgi:hypothetical protein